MTKHTKKYDKLPIQWSLENHKFKNKTLNIESFCLNVSIVQLKHDVDSIKTKIY